MNRQTSAVQKLGIETRGDSLYHRVRGAAMKAWREGRRIEIKLGRSYPHIFFQCRDMIRRRGNNVPLREAAVFCQGIGLILAALSQDHPDSEKDLDFAALSATCRVSQSGRVEALYIKPR